VYENEPCFVLPEKKENEKKKRMNLALCRVLPVQGTLYCKVLTVEGVLYRVLFKGPLKFYSSR